MAMNKVYMAFTLVFLFSLLAVSMVESRTLTADILEEKKPNVADQHVIDEILPNTNSESTKNVQSTQVIDEPGGTATAGTGQTPTSVRKSMMRNLPTELAKAYSTSSSGFEELSKTETSSSIDADSYVVNGNTLRSALPRNLKADVELSDVKTLTTTSSSKPITTTDATPVSVANPETRTSLEPVTNHSQSSVLEESSKTGEEESTEHVISTQVTNQPEGTATEESPKTKPESADNVKTVPRAIGAHVFYGKMVSGSEMYNMTTDEYYNQIYPTHKCDVFLIGKLLKVADTPHNRMVFAKFAEEESDSTSDDSTEKDVATDH